MELQCMVCLEPKNRGLIHSKAHRGCGKAICYDCYKRWSTACRYKVVTTCPTCRGGLTPKCREHFGENKPEKKKAKKRSGADALKCFENGTLVRCGHVGNTINKAMARILIVNGKPVLCDTTHGATYHTLNEFINTWRKKPYRINAWSKTEYCPTGCDPAFEDNWSSCLEIDRTIDE